MDKNATHNNTGSIVEQRTERHTKHSVKTDRGSSTSDNAGNTSFDNKRAREANDTKAKNIHVHSKTNTQTDIETDKANNINSLGKKHEIENNTQTRDTEETDKQESIKDTTVD